MTRVVQHEINVELTRQNVINSLNEEIFQLPLITIQFPHRNSQLRVS